MATPPTPDLLSYRRAGEAGLTRHQLDRLIAESDYDRVAPGVFLRAGLTDDTTALWVGVATKRPEATLCLLTAAALHDLTDEIPSASHIAIPRGTHAVAIQYPPVSWHRFDRDTYEIGRTLHSLPAGARIGLYSADRTIVDLFRLRHEWGSDVAVEALKRWLERPGTSPGALLRLADEFPKARTTLRQTLEVLL